eukprot:3936166-Prymnesium_polylepis.1
MTSARSRCASPPAGTSAARATARGLCLGCCCWSSRRAAARGRRESASAMWEACAPSKWRGA